MQCGNYNTSWVLLILLVFRSEVCSLPDWKENAIQLLSQGRKEVEAYELKLGNHTGDWQNYNEANGDVDAWIKSCPNDNAVFYVAHPVDEVHVEPQQAMEMGINLFRKIENPSVWPDLVPFATLTWNGMQFEIGEIIGSGGNAVIRAAKKVGEDQQYAIKWMRPEHKDELEREYETSINLHRGGEKFVPNVLRGSFNPYWFQGNPAFVTERLSGANLRQLLRVCQGTLSIAAIAYVMIGMLNCVEYVHNQGYLHGDLKLENFMLDGLTSSIKILDFFNTVKAAASGQLRSPGPPEYQSRAVKAGRQGSSNITYYPEKQDEVESLALILVELVEGYEHLKQAEPNWTSAELCPKCSPELLDFIEMARPPRDLQNPQRGKKKTEPVPYEALVELLKPLLSDYKNLDWNKRLDKLLHDPSVHHVEIVSASTREGTAIAFIPRNFYNELLTDLLRNSNSELMKAASSGIGGNSDLVDSRHFYLVPKVVPLSDQFFNSLLSGLKELLNELMELQIVNETTNIGFSYIVDPNVRSDTVSIVIAVQSPIVKINELFTEIRKPSIIVDTTILDHLNGLISSQRAQALALKQIIQGPLTETLLQLCRNSEEMLISPDCFAVYFQINTDNNSLLLKKYEVNIDIEELINRARTGDLSLLQLIPDLIPALYLHAFESVHKNKNLTPLHVAGSIMTFQLHVKTNGTLESITEAVCLSFQNSQNIPQIYNKDTSYISFGWTTVEYNSIEVSLYTETYFDKFLKNINDKRTNKLKLVDNNSEIEELAKKFKKSLPALCSNGKFIFSKKIYAESDYSTRDLALNDFLEREPKKQGKLLLPEFRSIGFTVYRKRVNWKICIYLGKSE